MRRSLRNSRPVRRGRTVAFAATTVHPAGLDRVRSLMLRKPVWLKLTLIATLAGVVSVEGQNGSPASGEWRTYGADLGSTRYVPHDQINAGNFGKLQVAWRFKTDVFGIRPDYNLQTTPLMINGVLYATAGARRDAVAIDAATGEALWMYRLDEGKRSAAAPRLL